MSATHTQHTVAADISADRQYIEGLKAGWNLAQANNEEAYQYIIDNRRRAISDASRQSETRPPASDLPELVRLCPDIECGRARKCTRSIGCMSRALIATAQQPATVEPLTRFCPGCGSVGPVDPKFRDCCPDGNKARLIPQRLAEHCHDLFQLALRSMIDLTDDTMRAIRTRALDEFGTGQAQGELWDQILMRETARTIQVTTRGGA